MFAPPYFAQGEDIDAVAEFGKFLDAVGEPASHLLAELADIQKNGTLSDIPSADDAATKVRGLHCRRVEGWAIFYAVKPAGRRCEITIVHVGSLNPHAFGALESEAATRLKNLIE
jgi:hypothetical protein